MAIETQLAKYETEAARGEKTRDAVVKELADLNRKLERETSDMLRAMFATDKQFEASLRRTMEDVSKQDKETVFSIGGKQFTIGNIDPAKVLSQRELTPFELGKLDTVRVTVDGIVTSAKATIGTVRRERVLLSDFQKDATSAAKELRSKASGKSQPGLVGQVDDFERLAGRMSAVTSELQNVQNQAAVLLRTAENASTLVGKVTSRKDIEQILTAAAGGFGVAAAVAAVVGSMGAAGILAVPALIAFAASRVVKLVNDITSADDK